MADHLFTIEGGRLRLHQHWGQTKAWDSLARIIAVVAGSQSGKTSWGPWWLNREIEICGGGDYLAVTSSFDLFKLKMLPEIRNVFEHVLGIGRYWSGDKVIELRDPGTGKFTAQRADDPMWGRIILRSAAAKGGLESSTAKAAWLDEAGQDEFTLDAYEAVRRRLTLHRGRILITTTPYNLGWLKQQIVDKADGKSIEVINFPSTVNPNFSQEEFDELRDTMPGWKFNMFMRGLYDRPPGMIFSDFKDEYRERGGHKVKPFELPKTWPRYAGIDPGVIHFCDVWIAYDSDNDIGYVYRESIRDRKSTKEHADEQRTRRQVGGRVQERDLQQRRLHCGRRTGRGRAGIRRRRKAYRQRHRSTAHVPPVHFRHLYRLARSDGHLQPRGQWAGRRVGSDQGQRTVPFLSNGRYANRYCKGECAHYPG